MSRRTPRVAVAVLAATTAAAIAMTTTAAQATTSPKPRPAKTFPVAKAHLAGHGGYAAKLKGGLARVPAGRQAVFVQLAGPSAVQAAPMGPNDATNPSVVDGIRADVAGQAHGVLAAAQGVDSRAHTLFTVSNLIRGVGMTLDPASLRAVARSGAVVKVTRLVPDHTTNANTAQLVRAVNDWKYANGIGKGVKIGVIDTGIDFTHSDFGGVGTVAAYKRAEANSADPNWRATLPKMAKAKIMGGYDFVGDSYNADPTASSYQPIPQPDQDPLDCNSHGTHVSGTAAGYGVNSGGKTFTGQYSHLDRAKLMKMTVGPGMAPGARIFMMKVFGCQGSTDEVIPALDMAMDPNGDGNFSDHLDIVNLSLGSDYSTQDDPENAVVNMLSHYGVLPVIASGNNGDLTDTGGSPGNANGALTAASSIDSYQLRDGLKVDAPANLAGIADGQMSLNYDWANNGPTGKPVTGTVTTLPSYSENPNQQATTNSDGCDPLTTAQAAAVAGKVAWLYWDDNDATRRCGSTQRSNNVAAAGAIGAVFTSSLNVFNAGISGTNTIPVFQLPQAQTVRLEPSVKAGTLRVTFDGKYKSTIKSITPSISDQLSSFTSRGVHGSIGVVKPDVTAPGDTIASAAMGTGHGVLVDSGTSMATPLISGVAAIVKGMHRSWKPLQLKADVMNTATHDLFTGPRHTGLKYAPARVGAGRVDALQAATNHVLVYSHAKNNGVSASFGVVPAPINKARTTLTRKVTVTNTGAKATRVYLRYQGIDNPTGVTYTVSPSTLTVPGHTSRSAVVTMTVAPRKLRHTIDPTMEKTQLGVPRQFVSDASGRLLVTPKGSYSRRLPVYGAAKPVSTTTVSHVARYPGKTPGVTHGTLTLSGQGVTNGQFPNPGTYTSLASVLQLGASSGRLPACTGPMTSGCTNSPSGRAGDLKDVGAASYSMDGDRLIDFGIATYGDWPTVGNSLIPYVDIDTNGDGKPDYEVYVQNYPATDVLLANTVNLSTNQVVDQEPVNNEWGNVDTNVFDTNVLLMPVFASTLGLPTDGSSAPITYRVGTYDANIGSDIDEVGFNATTGNPTIPFDAGRPAVQTDGPLYYDDGGSSIKYTATGSGTRLLVLHLDGANGKRQQVFRAG